MSENLGEGAIQGARKHGILSIVHGWPRNHGISNFASAQYLDIAHEWPRGIIPHSCIMTVLLLVGKIS